MCHFVTFIHPEPADNDDAVTQMCDVIAAAVHSDSTQNRNVWFWITGCPTLVHGLVVLDRCQRRMQYWNRRAAGPSAVTTPLYGRSLYDSDSNYFHRFLGDQMATVVGRLKDSRGVVIQCEAVHQATACSCRAYASLVLFVFTLAQLVFPPDRIHLEALGTGAPPVPVTAVEGFMDMLQRISAANSGDIIYRCFNGWAHAVSGATTSRELMGWLGVTVTMTMADYGHGRRDLRCNAWTRQLQRCDVPVEEPYAFCSQHVQRFIGDRSLLQHTIDWLTRVQRAATPAEWNRLLGTADEHAPPRWAFATSTGPRSRSNNDNTVLEDV